MARSNWPSTLLSLFAGTALLLSTACGGDDGGATGPDDGAIAVSVSTTGSDLDPDGYVLSLAGENDRAIGVNGSTTFSGVATGQHSVQLSGLAGNCSVTGDNPATASVSGGSTAQVTFQVACAALGGSVQVTVSTTGQDLDPDGYTVTIDGGSDRSIGLNGVTTYTGVSAGSHPVELAGLADNCSVSGSNPATASVTAGETTQVGFDVVCEALPIGSLEITTTVTNNFDPDGYEVRVAGALAGRVDVNGTATFDDVAAGAQQVELAEIAPHCAVDGDNPATVDIPVGGTRTHTFTVTCTNPPDGRIVYYGALQGTYGYIVMNADGSGRILILECGGDRQCREPQWSPDGLKIAFAMSEPDFSGPESIYTINQDGSGLSRVTNGGYDRHPAWSPDGTKILFDHGTVLCCDVPRSLYVVNADGTGLTEIPRDNPMFREDDAGWSPDGTQIAFSGMAQDYQEPGIYVMDAAGGLATKISEDPPGCDAGGEPGAPSWLDGFVGGRLEWSPDGTRILFTRNYSQTAVGPCVDGSGWDDLLVMNADGTDVSYIVENPDQHAIHPSWSPDGSKIVYDGGDWTIHVVNADGTGDVAIIPGGNVSAVSPDWGP